MCRKRNCSFLSQIRDGDKHLDLSIIALCAFSRKLLKIFFFVKLLKKSLKETNPEYFLRISKKKSLKNAYPATLRTFVRTYYRKNCEYTPCSTRQDIQGNFICLNTCLHFGVMFFFSLKRTSLARFLPKCKRALKGQIQTIQTPGAGIINFLRP